MNSEAKILIAGAGGLGSEVEAFLHSRGVLVSGYLDDWSPSYPNIDAYEPQANEQVVVAIGEPKGREAVVERLKARKARFHGVLLNWAAYNARVGGGCILFPHSVVSAHAQVGYFVQVGFAGLVGHHVTVGDYCSLSCHVDLTGNVTVGRGCFFGTGARVLPGVKIGDYCTIGAGAVVIRDVPDGATVFGNPAGRI